MKKKLMLLGGIRYLLPVIKKAHELGAHVITADYLPGNIAHKYSDEYVNVSVLDREAVLAAARERNIDGILSFGVDPGVVTAAYVAERLNLSFPSLAAVEILQNKDKFRDFLENNGFNCPKRYQPTDDIEYPVIVKPVDSAGSKGCSKVNSAAELSAAIEYARSESHSGRIIIEQFLANAYSSSDTDSFSIDNDLVFCSFNCQHFDVRSPNPYTPAAYSWPSDMPLDAQAELRGELQRLIRLLNLGTSIYNIETRVAIDGKPYIMEISPRGGGNRLSEVLEMGTGQSPIENAVRGALRMPMREMKDPLYDGFWTEVIVHSNMDGAYRSLSIAENIRKKNLIQEDMWVSPGDHVSGFSGANQAIGTLILRFDSIEASRSAMTNISEWLSVEVAE